MPRLFESFIAEWLRERIPSEYIVRNQYIVNFDAEANFLFRIDVVIVDANTGENLCVLDTKYKTSSKPEERDIQQIFTYAATTETKHAYLVYPSAISTPLDAKKLDIAIKSIVFDISKDPDEAGNLFLQQLLDHLHSVR